VTSQPSFASPATSDAENDNSAHDAGWPVDAG